MREKEKKGDRLMRVRVEYENVDREDEWNEDWTYAGSEDEFHATYDSYYPV